MNFKKTFFLLLISFFMAPNAFSVWSGFGHVTKENAAKFKQLDLTVIKIPQTTQYKIKFKNPSPKYKQAWLVVTKNGLSKKEQELRWHYVWEYYKKDKETKFDASKITVFTKISDLNAQAGCSTTEEHSHYEIVLDASLLKRSYIYIDFPSIVADGGFYFSIDLSTF